MKVITTKGGKFKGLSLTSQEVSKVKEIYKGSCQAVAEREIAKEFNVSPALASKIFGAVAFGYKYLTVEE